jgi:hypothetical protein
MALKSVYKPENELMAVTIKSLLEESGIQAMIHSFQIPWYNGLAKMMKPAWGEILVDEDDYTEAADIIRNFLAAEKESSPEDNSDPGKP